MKNIPSLTFGHFVGGIWITPQEGTPLVRYSPLNNSICYQGTSFPISKIPEVIKNSVTAQKDWYKTSPEKKIRFLHALEAALSEMREEIVTCLMHEVGKTSWEAHQEVDACISKIAHTIESFEIVQEKTLIATEKKELSVVRKPIGVSLVLAPFNFPFHLALGQIAPLLLSGNCVILKPSELTPLSGQLLSECIKKAFSKFHMESSGVFQMVQGGKDVGDALVRSPEIKGVYFTGSEKVGHSIEKTSLDFSGRMVALEMGGNNPIVVRSYSSLHEAIALIIMSAYLTTGQRCTAARRLILVESPENRKLLDCLQKTITELPYGCPTDYPTVFMGPLISQEAKEKIIQRYHSLLQMGAKPLVPLTKHCDPSLCPSPCYINPILLDVTGLETIDEEDFGPLLKVLWMPSYHEAIQEANRTRFGLSASLISENDKDFQIFLEEMSCGIINWNCPTTGASSRAPFGGIGNSGNFRPAGFSMMESCCYPVTTTKDRSGSFLESLPEQIRSFIIKKRN